MKSNVKKIMFFCLLFLFVPIVSKAEGIEIIKYDSIIKVSKKRIAKVEENYSVYFSKNKNSIIRTLDKKMNLIRPDKSSTIISSKINNISSNNTTEVKQKDKLSEIRINVDGEKDSIKDIKLMYDYNLGKDSSRSYDEFYYNIVSNFDNLISNIAFMITLPKDAKIKDIDFSIDEKYNLSKDDISYDVKDNVITGYLNTMLYQNQKFSVRVELKNNYFTKATDNFNYISYIYVPIEFLILLIIFSFWYKYGRRNNIKKKFSYYPPYNFDSAEIGYLYKGKSEEIDLISVIISLANDGYLKIEEYDDGYKLNKENSFKFIKLKDYDKKNAVKKILFEGIFKDKDEIELKDIEYSIMDKLLDAKKVLDNSDNHKKMFYSNINSVKLVSVMLIVISVLLLNIPPIKIYTESYLLVPVITVIMTYGLFITFVFNNKFLVRIIFFVLFVLGSMYFAFYSLIGQTHYIIIYITSIMFIFIMLILYKKIPFRTKFGNEKLGEVYGFKVMLETMTPYKLKELLEENPNYYYEMIPYASVFGILDEWMNKGKDLIISSPSWHISTYDYKLQNENKFLKNLLYTTTQVLIKGIYAKVSNIDFEEQKVKTNLNE